MFTCLNNENFKDTALESMLIEQDGGQTNLPPKSSFS